jgi:hypothetical protein
MVSPKGLHIEHTDILHATYRLKIASVVGINDNKTQVSVGMLMKRPN